VEKDEPEIAVLDRDEPRLERGHVGARLRVDIAEERPRASRSSPVEMPVMPLEDVLVTKLLAITETQLDFRSVLALARAVREQVDWDVVRERTESSPFARSFFTLVEELEIVPAGSIG
jgi:hypothetical protein